MIPEEYKKMVLALPDEFFAGWEWKYGDAFLLKENSGWNVYHIGEYLLENGKIGFENVWDGDFVYEDHEIKPSPNQEQLQELILKIKKEREASDSYEDVWNLSDFHEFIDTHNIEWMHLKSLNCMWLEYLMDFKYNKKWDGEKWI